MRHLASIAIGSLWLAACSSAETADVGSVPADPSPGQADAGSSSTSSSGGRSSSGAGSSSGGASGASSSGAGSSGAGSSGAGSSGSSGSSSGGAPPSGGSSSGGKPDGGTAADGGSPPARNAKCTPLSEQTGTAVNTTHGRLDGTLVYVVPVGGSSACNGDGSHVHLQVEVQGNVYDVAVDIGKSGDEVGWYEQAMAMPGAAWSEGWHGADGLGYSSLKLGASQFTTMAPSSLGAQLESLLANTAQISIYCTGYTPGDNGCHDVHYQDGTSNDGAIVLDPTSSTPHVVFFRFTSQSF